MSAIAPLGRNWAALAWALLLTVVLGLPFTARADTAIGLFKSISGNVNFAGTQVTIRDRASGADPCAVSAPSVSQSATLSMPAGATVLSAHLYWAGSGASDTGVNMNSRPINGDPARSYTSATIGGGFDYFSVAADVTSQVKARGAGTYTFSGLSVGTGSPWCGRSAVVGGFALVVVYSHPDEIYRTLNLYEGFRALLNSEVRLDMSNFRVPPNVSASAVGRFGHLVWEGDAAIAQEGESLYFHNILLTNSTYAPSGNNFNSKSSINADTLSMGIDYDSYSLSGWPAGLNSVSAQFRSGGDMVLLNAAVLAVPSTPAADLSIDLVRTTELRGGSTATYTATVTNLGPGADSGPIKLNFTLPAGLTYSSATGTNWSCSASGASVACTYQGALTNGASTVLSLKVLVAAAASGSKTITASVIGNNDPGTTNNQDSDTATVVSSGGISFEYTSRACTSGELVGNGGTCPLFAGPVYAGATPTIFLTAVDSGNRARTPNSSASTAVALDLALGCVDPSSSGGRKATYGGVVLPECVKDDTVATSSTAWTRVNATFAAGQISLGVTFQYFDVGAVKLYVRTTSNAIDFAQFVSMPHALGLTVTNTQGQVNPGQASPGTTGLAQTGFVRAGEKFTLAVKALSVIVTVNGATGRYELPNFGREEGTRPVLTNTVTRKEVPSSSAATLPAAPLEGAYPASGTFASMFSWSDIGNIELRVGLADYLGEQPAASGVQAVGRFYPAYFTTETGGEEDTALAGFACLTRMSCPIVGLPKVKGAIYSNQPFDVTIKAHDEGGQQLFAFNRARYPTLIPTLTLTAVDAPGTGTAFGTRISGGLADTPGNASTRSVRFKLGAAYDAGAVRAAWLGPTAVYLRATAPESRMGSSLTITSIQADVAESQEGGIMVVNGRLSVGSVIGAQLLRTPVPLQAQYWTGRNWENNPSFSAPALLDTAQAQFTNCQKSLATSGVAPPSNCNNALVRAAAAGPLALTNGVARFVLAPVGAGQSGSLRMRMVGVDWLPSSFGQVTIGTYSSPLIYVREIY